MDIENCNEGMNFRMSNNLNLYLLLKTLVLVRNQIMPIMSKLIAHQILIEKGYAREAGLHIYALKTYFVFRHKTVISYPCLFLIKRKY